MPAVFHTKTIQEILDPVAQQVSHLIILHEEAEQGRIVPDISQPVIAVSAAVKNLLLVGKQTMDSSKDEVLRADMPATFVVVEESCNKLEEAASGLAADKDSKPARQLLLGGARGILQGVSGLLLVFDQSEVRKIVKSCEGIIEYLKVAEVVQMMEELVMFTKNLSPGMTSMTKLVDARTQDLTNASHAAILEEESEQVKRALPLLLSSMKAFVTLTRDRKKGGAEAQENRNYIVIAITESIHEIIRVLQLTSPTEEKGAFANELGGEATGLPGGVLPGTLAAKVITACELIMQTGTDEALNREGIAAVDEVLKEARKMARGLPPAKREVIEALCDEIEALARELADLQARGEGDSPRAREIAALLAEKMTVLEKELRMAIAKKITEDFKDPLGPVNALSQAALAPLDTPARDETYGKRVSDFQQHAKKMADTAAALAKSGVVTDRVLADDLIRTSGKVKALAPQVVHASKMAFENPDNEAVREHFQRVKEDYMKQVDKLTGLVDSGLDPLEFVEASEQQLREDLEAAKVLTKAGSDPQAAFAHIASAARTSNRVIVVTKSEVDNTLDPTFKRDLCASHEAITTSIAPMVTSARASITKPGDVAAHEDFSRKADNLVTAVHNVHDVMDAHYNPPPPPPRPPSPIEKVVEVPVRPPTPEEELEAVPTKAQDPIGFAAHQLNKDAKQWEDNEMVEAAKRMAKLMMQMAKFTRGEGGELHSKKELIQTARLIAKESEAVVKMAKKVAAACTDKRMQRAILQVVDKLPTISTQLKIIATVKASRQGGDDPEADREAGEMLTDNAQNLMSAVSEVLYATEAATIRVPPEAREELGLQWVKRA